MSEDIIDVINENLYILDKLNIPKKFVGDQLTAVEYNKTVDKINELLLYLNDANKSTIIDITTYLMNRINDTYAILHADNITLSESTDRTILDDLNDIHASLFGVNETVTQHTTSIDDITDRLANIYNELGIVKNDIAYVNDDIDKLDAKIDTSYDAAISYTETEVNKSYKASISYTETEVNKSYNKIYTYITDTTLTFDYDIHTDEPVGEVKDIYDNANDLYDGSYHN